MCVLVPGAVGEADRAFGVWFDRLIPPSPRGAERAKEAVPPTPLFFGSADSKGVAGAFSVSADSKRVISPVFATLAGCSWKCGK